MIKIDCKVIEKASGKIVAYRTATKATKELAMEDIAEQVEVGYGSVGDEGDYELIISTEEIV